MRRRLSHVEITERSVVIDGKDISHLSTGVDVHIGINQAPTVHVHTVPYMVMLDLADAVVSGWPPRPLDGIDRLRERFSR